MAAKQSLSPIDREIMRLARVYATALEQSIETPTDENMQAMYAASKRLLLAAQQLMPPKTLERLAGVQTGRVMR